jgi:AcrR family transcriptional regulator
MDDETARTLVLDAADGLFYEQGIRGVGMDQIRDASGVSLKRLYRMFPAKEQLAEAVLRRRDLTFQGALAAHVAGVPGTRARLLSVFDFLHGWFAEPGFRGCPFVNAYGEMGAASACIAAAVTDQKEAFRAFLADLVAEAGATSEVADQLFVLANGAMVAAAVLRSPEPARQAKRAAEVLLDAAG